MNAKIQFTCPHCSHTMQLPAAAEGRQGKCPSCAVVITIAAQSTDPLQANSIQEQHPQPSEQAGSPDEKREWFDPRGWSGREKMMVLGVSLLILVVYLVMSPNVDPEPTGSGNTQGPDNTRPQRDEVPADLPSTEIEIDVPAAIEKLADGVELSVVIEKLANGKARLTGITNLPVGTSLSCSVRATTGGFIGQGKATVTENGTYQTDFGPATGLKSGKYTASVTCPFAFRQPEIVRDVIGKKGENLKGPLVSQNSNFGATVSNETSFSIP
jgi:hypothetical protein